jgi:hypothetical protein
VLQENKGLAIFSSLDADLWQVILLPVAIRDQLIVKDRPFIRPLEVLLSEYACTLAILADQSTARLLVYDVGRVEEITSSQPVPVTGASANSAHDRIRALVSEAEAVWNERGCTRMVIGGDSQTIQALREALPEALGERLIGELPVDPQIGHGEFRSAMIEIEADFEHDLEKQRVEALISGAQGGGNAVLGLEQTLLSVRGGKVRLLVIEDGFHLEGGECPSCGFLGEGKEGVCLLCGVALRPEPDIIEAAMKRAIDTGGAVEILRSPEWCKALAAHARIGALIETEGAPEVKDYANRRIMSKGGKINRDVLHDEAIEESFPASDPPAF